MNPGSSIQKQSRISFNTGLSSSSALKGFGIALALVGATLVGKEVASSIGQHKYGIGEDTALKDNAFFNSCVDQKVDTLHIAEENKAELKKNIHEWLNNPVLFRQTHSPLQIKEVFHVINEVKRYLDSFNNPIYSLSYNFKPAQITLKSLNETMGTLLGNFESALRNSEQSLANIRSSLSQIQDPLTSKHKDSTIYSINDKLAPSLAEETEILNSISLHLLTGHLDAAQTRNAVKECKHKLLTLQLELKKPEYIDQPIMTSIHTHLNHNIDHLEALILQLSDDIALSIRPATDPHAPGKIEHNSSPNSCYVAAMLNMMSGDTDYTTVMAEIPDISGDGIDPGIREPLNALIEHLSSGNPLNLDLRLPLQTAITSHVDARLYDDFLGIVQNINQGNREEKAKLLQAKRTTMDYSFTLGEIQRAISTLADTSSNTTQKEEVYMSVKHSLNHLPEGVHKTELRTILEAHYADERSAELSAKLRDQLQTMHQHHIGNVVKKCSTILKSDSDLETKKSILKTLRNRLQTEPQNPKLYDDLFTVASLFSTLKESECSSIADRLDAYCPMGPDSEIKNLEIETINTDYPINLSYKHERQAIRDILLPCVEKVQKGTTVTLAEIKEIQSLFLHLQLINQDHISDEDPDSILKQINAKIRGTYPYDFQTIRTIDVTGLESELVVLSPEDLANYTLIGPGDQTSITEVTKQLGRIDLAITDHMDDVSIQSALDSALKITETATLRACRKKEDGDENQYERFNAARLTQTQYTYTLPPQTLSLSLTTLRTNESGIKVQDRIQLTNDDGTLTEYQLSKVHCHSGGRLSGHEFCYLKRDEKWYLSDDLHTHVQPANLADNDVHSNNICVKGRTFIYTKCDTVSETENRLIYTPPTRPAHITLTASSDETSLSSSTHSLSKKRLEDKIKRVVDRSISPSLLPKETYFTDPDTVKTILLDILDIKTPEETMLVEEILTEDFIHDLSTRKDHDDLFKEWYDTASIVLSQSSLLPTDLSQRLNLLVLHYLTKAATISVEHDRSLNPVDLFSDSPPDYYRFSGGGGIELFMEVLSEKLGIPEEFFKETVRAVNNQHNVTESISRHFHRMSIDEFNRLSLDEKQSLIKAKIKDSDDPLTLKGLFIDASPGTPVLGDGIPGEIQRVSALKDTILNEIILKLIQPNTVLDKAPNTQQLVLEHSKDYAKATPEKKQELLLTIKESYKSELGDSVSSGQYKNSFIDGDTEEIATLKRTHDFLNRPEDIENVRTADELKKKLLKCTTFKSLHDLSSTLSSSTLNPFLEPISEICTTLLAQLSEKTFKTEFKKQLGPQLRNLSALNTNITALSEFNSKMKDSAPFEKAIDTLITSISKQRNSVNSVLCVASFAEVADQSLLIIPNPSQDQNDDINGIMARSGNIPEIVSIKENILKLEPDISRLLPKIRSNYLFDLSKTQPKMASQEIDRSKRFSHYSSEFNKLVLHTTSEYMTYKDHLGLFTQHMISGVNNLIAEIEPPIEPGTQKLIDTLQSLFFKHLDDALKVQDDIYLFSTKLELAFEITLQFIGLFSSVDQSALERQISELINVPDISLSVMANSGMGAIDQIIRAMDKEAKNDHSTKIHGVFMDDVYYENHKLLTQLRDKKDSPTQDSLPTYTLTQASTEEDIALCEDPIDLLIVDVNPNDARKQNLKLRNIKQMIDTIKREGKFPKHGPLKIVLDTTLSHFSKPEIQSLLHQLNPHISAGEIQVILFESFAKFAQVGQDKTTGGCVVTIDNKNKKSAAFSTALRDIAQIGGPSSLSINLFSFMFTHANDDIERHNSLQIRNAQRFYDHLNTTLSENPHKTPIITVAGHGDAQVNYVALNYLGFASKYFTTKTGDIDESSLKKFNLAIMTRLLKKASQKHLPLKERSSFGFATSNVTECITTIRLTCGLENDKEFREYAKIIKEIEDDLQALLKTPDFSKATSFTPGKKSDKDSALDRFIRQLEKMD